MNIRRNLFIRTVAAVTGDLVLAFSIASACTWAIQVATLGLFRSFLLWLVALIGYLALSQFLLHPALAALLSDRKLDDGLALSAETVRATAEIARQVWRWAYRRGYVPRPAP